MQIGIIGHGFVGQALTQWLIKNNSDVEIRISDPAKGLDDDMPYGELIAPLEKINELFRNRKAY